MAKTIIRKVKFDFQTSNLENISKTIEKMKPILGKKEVESANQIQNQIETILKSMETNEGLFSADGVKLIRSEIDKVLRSFRGLTDGFQLDPAILKEQNKFLEREAELQEKILENKKEIARLEKDVSGTDEHGFPKASRALSQSNMPLGAAVSATTGNELKRFSA